MDESSDYEKEVVLIKRELRKFTTASFLAQFVKFFSFNSTNNVEFMKRAPWCCFLAFKWKSIQGDSQARGEAREIDFRDIVQRVYDLQSKIDIDSGEFQLIMRRFVVPQVLYQSPMVGSHDSLARQFVWFCKSGDDFFEVEFKKTFGISLREYYGMSLLLICWLVTLKREAASFSLSSFIVLFHPAYSLESISAFLSIISVKIDDIQGFFSDFENHEMDEWEYFQDTPMLYKPLVYLGSTLYVPCVRVAIVGLTCLAPDFFKREYGSSYKERFGRVMENYVGRVLSGLDGDVVREEDILDKYKDNGVSGKVVDFYIPGDEGSVFVDSKAIEPSGVVKNSKDPSLLKARLLDSFIKGVFQIEACASLMRRCGYESNGALDAGLVVTHKDHFVSSGQKIIDGMYEGLEEEVVKEAGEVMVPLKRIYYLPVDDLEALVSICAGSGRSLNQIIKECEERDSDKSSAKMNFYLHLLEYSSVPMEKYAELVEASRDLFGDFEGALENKSRFWDMKVVYFLECRRRVISLLHKG